MAKTIVIQPGGYHPFHAGHYALYQSVLKAFPDADVYVAATDDTKVRPFPFKIKEKLAKVAGVKPGRFVRVTSPFKAEEITRKYDPNTDVLIFVRSEKDRNENPKPGGIKKDGTPSYFQPYTGKNLEPFSKHAYFAYLPTVTFGPGIKSATEIRNSWPNLNDRQKTAMVMSLYPVTQKKPELAKIVVKLLDQGMGSHEINEELSDNRVLDTAQHMIQRYKDSAYTAYERATSHAMNYESNDPRYDYWVRVADEIKKQTPGGKKREMGENTERALQFATKAHTGQARAGGEPYIKHPMRVADSIRKYKQSHNIDALISAALLHDTIEDTGTTHEALHDLFGGLVASLVKELTSDKEQIAKMGKSNYLAHKMATMSSYALVIKLADRLDNVRDIVTAKTPEWRAKYKAQTEHILNFIENNRVLSGTHRKFIDLIREKLSEINGPNPIPTGKGKESVLGEAIRKKLHSKNIDELIDYLDEN